MLRVTHHMATEPRLLSSPWECVASQTLPRRTQVDPLYFHSCLGFDSWDASGVLTLSSMYGQEMVPDPDLEVSLTWKQLIWIM